MLPHFEEYSSPHGRIRDSSQRNPTTRAERYSVDLTNGGEATLGAESLAAAVAFRRTTHHCEEL
jgi:hypothetical protein